MAHLEPLDGSILKAIEVLKKLDELRAKQEVRAIQFGSRPGCRTDANVLNDCWRGDENGLAAGNPEIFDSAKIELLEGLQQAPSRRREGRLRSSIIASVTITFPSGNPTRVSREVLGREYV